MLLLRALAGSRLYGTSKPDSDWDWYEVHDQVRPYQSKRGDLDVTRMPLSKWVLLCEKGTHQALDAMWCPPRLCEVDRLTAWRLSFRVDPYRAARQLETTAHAMGGEKHYDRLMFCAKRVRDNGWYDPSEYGRQTHEQH